MKKQKKMRFTIDVFEFGQLMAKTDIERLSPRFKKKVKRWLDRIYEIPVAKK